MRGSLFCVCSSFSVLWPVSLRTACLHCCVRGSLFCVCSSFSVLWPVSLRTACLHCCAPSLSGTNARIRLRSPRTRLRSCRQSTKGTTRIGSPSRSQTTNVQRQSSTIFDTCSLFNVHAFIKNASNLSHCCTL